MEFYSHPDKKLIKHLKEVRDMALLSLPKEFYVLGEIASLTHDFGKYTTFFQKYLFSKEKEKSRKSNHGFISAVFAAYCGLKEFGEKSKYPYLLYSAILHHHGNLENPGCDLPAKMKIIDREEDEISLIEKIDAGMEQLYDIEENLKYISCDYKDTVVEKYLSSFVKEKPIEKILLILKKNDFFIDKFNKGSEEYFVHQMIYSSIINSDKLSASNTFLPEKQFISFDKLNGYKAESFKDSPKSKLNDIRSEIFNEIQREVESSYNKNKLFSITSPTGTGKTYSGFFAALKLREMLGGDRKIIYALPFTSIIDQSYKAVGDLMEHNEDYVSNKSTYLIKHHNLATVEYEYTPCDYSRAQAELIIESWNSGIIVTTFVQLLQTLIGTRNRMLKKFNSIRDSVIILDEIQAIDIKFYNLVDFILREAANRLNCSIIMMTATKPLMLKDAHELLKDNKVYFSMFNRTILYPQLNKILTEDFIDIFNENKEDKSYLIICNTINQSLEIFNKLKEIHEEVYYLSTNLIPIHRREIIEKIKRKLKKGEKPILVSTQVVEAGVDFDFDVVIRDIAPLDSIIQAAGRCNRNGKKANGEVYIYNMVKENGTAYGELVYGKTLLNISKDILSEGEWIEEKEYFNLISKYFEEVSKNVNNEASTEFIKSIEKLRFSYEPKEKYSLNRFSLIKSNPDYFDVFFIKDEKAQDIFNRLMKTIGEKDFNKKKESYLDIKSEIRNYTLSLPIKFKDKVNYRDIIPNVPIEAYHDVYDSDTGFKRIDEEDYFVF